jgi:phage terminase large subunit-like protein
MYSPQFLNRGEGLIWHGGAMVGLASFDVLVFPPDESEQEHGEYHVLPFFWIPENNMIRRVKKDKVPYQKRNMDGFPNATEGNIIHYDIIEQKTLELSRVFKIKAVMYDSWGCNADGAESARTRFRDGGIYTGV